MVLHGYRGFILYMVNMYCKKLIKEARILYEIYPIKMEKYSMFNVFQEGAKWMYEMLEKLEGTKSSNFNNNVNFNLYGVLKYGICLSFFVISFISLWYTHPLLTPLSIITFYLVEIHFLFLFPLLIDHSKKPMVDNIHIIYKIGICKTLITIIPIGCYMMIGLFNFKNPFYNWYIGCLSILIWYKDEVRNRI